MKSITRFSVLLMVLLFSIGIVTSQDLSIKSPDGKLNILIELSETINWSVHLDGNIIIEKAIISMNMGDNRVLGASPKLRSKSTESVRETLAVQVPNKDAIIQNNFNELALNFKGGYQLLFRAFNDGIAYQFIDKSSKTKTVVNEQLTLTFPEGSSSFFPQEESMYSHNEREYLNKNISDISTGEFCSLPVMFDTKKAKVLFTESSLHNYPGLFLAKDRKNSFSATFPKFVLKAIPMIRSQTEIRLLQKKPILLQKSMAKDPTHGGCSLLVMMIKLLLKAIW